MPHFIASLAVISALSLQADPDTSVVSGMPDSMAVTACSKAKPQNDCSGLRLSEEDYRKAAEKLGVETAVIKAVVEIEAGRSHNGFHAPGMPLINFDLAMFKRAAARRSIKLSKYSRSHREVFARPNARRYGSRQAAQHARLAGAMSIETTAAIDGTFWGMFQIGGFNWKKCGASSREDFVMRMSRSEHDQLDMFVNFVMSEGIDRFLRKKDWAGFARRYNGPSYKKRRYHTRMANAYKRIRKNSAD